MGKTKLSRHWCTKGCGKRVIYLIRFKDDVKPFVCQRCLTRFSHDKLDLRKRSGLSYVFSEKNHKLSKALRQHCTNVFIEKNRS